MKHTADPKSQPGLAYACDLVCRLNVGECISISRTDAKLMEIHANPMVGGTPYDRIMGNIIGSYYNFTLRIDACTGDGIICRVEPRKGERTYLDPDRRIGGPESTVIRPLET